MSFLASWPQLSWVILGNAVLATCLACLVAVVERRGWRATWVHGLWLVVILRFLAPPLVPWGILPVGEGSARLAVAGSSAPPSVAPPVAGPTGTEHRDDIVAAVPVRSSAAPTPATTTSKPPSTLEERFAEYRTFGGPGLLVLLWSAVSCLLLLHSLRRVAQFMGLARRGQPAPTQVRRRSAELAAGLGLRRVPEVRLVADRRLGSPMLLAAWGAPKLLLPKALFDELQADELDTVLAHELAHLRRRDHWVRWPELAAAVIFWWHPVFWWARKSLRRVEERCVDEWVLRLLPGSGRAYAEALLKTLELTTAQPYATPALASGIETMTSMESRLTMILTYRNRPSRPSTVGRVLRWSSLPLLLAALAVLPTWARPEPGEPPHDAGAESRAQAEGAARAAANAEFDDHFAPDAHEHDAHEHPDEGEERARRRQELAGERQHLEERRRQVAVEQERRRSEATRQLADIEQYLQANGSLDEQEKARMLQEAEQLETRLALEVARTEHESQQIEAEALAIDAEVAYLSNDLELAEQLAERHFEMEMKLHDEQAAIDERETALHVEEVRRQLAEQNKTRQQLVDAGRKDELQRLEHHMARLQLEERRALAERQMHKQRQQLQQDSRKMEREMRALASRGEEERAAAARAMQAEHRRLEAKQRQLESDMRRAHVQLELEEIRTELPMRIEELRLALEEGDGDDAALRTELERLHRELGDVLAKK